MNKTNARPNRPALALHVPEPPFRPGDAPDFSSLKVPPAGEAARPDVVARAEETFPLCTHLVRVLDDQGNKIGTLLNNNQRILAGSDQFDRPGAADGGPRAGHSPSLGAPRRAAPRAAPRRAS